MFLRKIKYKILTFSKLKLKVHDIFTKDEKTTKFKAVNDENVINNTCLDEKLSEIESNFSYTEKHHNDFEILSNKQSVEEVLIQRVEKTTIRILYHMDLIDKYDSVDEVLKDFCLFKDVDLISSNVSDDNVIQGFGFNDFWSFTKPKATSNTKTYIVLSPLSLINEKTYLRDGP